MKTVKGNDLVIMLDEKTIYHAQTHDFSSNAEFEEWETKDTGGKRFELSGITGTASANGIVCISESADTSLNTMDSPALMEAHLNGKELGLTLKIEDKVYTCSAWIETVQFTGEAGKKSTYSASFRTNALVPQSNTAQTPEE